MAPPPRCARSSRRPFPTGRSRSSSGTAPRLPATNGARPGLPCRSPDALGARAARARPARPRPRLRVRRARGRRHRRGARRCSTPGSRRRSTARAPAAPGRRRRARVRRRCAPPPRARRGAAPARQAPQHPSATRRAVRHHYDVSNEFFALFLDESMTYSCALFSRGAPRRSRRPRSTKLELVCRKLALEPGERLLDVGCGWGSFAIHAAAQHGVQVTGITLSEPQAALAAAAGREARRRATASRSA